MGKPLSMDLRERVIAAIDAGLSRRAAAARYGIAPSTAIRWDIERRTAGSFAPKPQGGDMRSRNLEGNAEVIHAALEETPDMTLAELCVPLSGRDIAASSSSLWRFFRRHGISRKKDRPRRRTGSPGRPEEASRLGFTDNLTSNLKGWSSSPLGRLLRNRLPGNGRNLDRDEHDAQPWQVPKRRKVADGVSTRTPQDHNAGCWIAQDWHGRTDDARRTDQR